MTLSQPVHDLALALWNSPEIFLILVGLNVLGVVLQNTPVLPNRFNWVIPLVLYVMGILFTPLLVPTTIFPASTKHPGVLLGIIGFLIGFAAWFLHDVVIQWAVKRYFPQSQPTKTNNQGNT